MPRLFAFGDRCAPQLLERHSILMLPLRHKLPIVLATRSWQERKAVRQALEMTPPWNPTPSITLHEEKLPDR
jgi:hypothetical protein